MSFIVIEGCDLTGKSTLAQSLKQHYEERGEQAVVHHYGPPERKTAIEEYIEPYHSYHPMDPDRPHIIVDRFHVGEAVWPEFFDRRPRMTKTERELIELWLLSRGALAILARRDPEDLVRAFREADPPEPLAPEDAPRAQEKFEHEFRKVACAKMYYDHTMRKRLVPQIVTIADELVGR